VPDHPPLLQKVREIHRVDVSRGLRDEAGACRVDGLRLRFLWSAFPER
jgi:hypothetical protein